MPNIKDRKSICKVRPIGVRITAWILSFSGFILSSLAVSSCRFAKVAKSTAAGSISVRFVGIYNFQTSPGLCVSSSLISSLPGNDGVSSSLKAARAFGVFAALLGGVAMMWMLVSILFTGTNKPLWTTQASLLVASAFFQLICFIAFNDDICKDDRLNQIFVKCSIEEGSAFAIFAIIFYLLSSIGAFLVFPPRLPVIHFEQGWRGGGEEKEGGGATNNTPAAHTTVAVHREYHGPTSSTAPPPMDCFPTTDNLLNAGASVSHPVVQHIEEQAIVSSTYAEKESFPTNEKLLHACASVSHGAARDERSGILSSVEYENRRDVTVEV